MKKVNLDALRQILMYGDLYKNDLWFCFCPKVEYREMFGIPENEHIARRKLYALLKAVWKKIDITKLQ